jgi:hypothetical protein
VNSPEAKLAKEWARLEGGEDYLLAPVAAGYCRYESLKDGTLDLADIELMNQYLDCQARNRALVTRMEQELAHGNAA